MQLAKLASLHPQFPNTNEANTRHELTRQNARLGEIQDTAYFMRQRNRPAIPHTYALDKRDRPGVGRQQLGFL